ncbi:MAG: hypothetical protein JEZ07_13035 [Phycisphaerae bacterium]|nr:hypothetical protein [Phycisphaerae bacterium]
MKEDVNLVQINNFARRQTKHSEFTHFINSWEELADLTTEQFRVGNYSEGYRDGVVIVHLPPDSCSLFLTYSGFPMYEGIKLNAEYRKIVGREHEAPRIIITPAEPKLQCKYVDIILYRADVLEEDSDRSTDAAWEIVSINGRLCETASPLSSMAIVRNWKHLPGGTEMKGATVSDVLEMLCQAVMHENSF